MTEPKYPECEKLNKVSSESQVIGRFLEWLEGEKELVIGKFNSIDDLLPTALPIESLIADFFNIDMKKVEEEQRQMLRDIKRWDKESKELMAFYDKLWVSTKMI